MSIRLKVDRNKTSVETDYHDSFGIDHSRAYEDRELIGAMKSIGVSEIEGKKAECGTGRMALRDAFDEKYKELNGRKYFGW
jgi:hypothetical protein